MTKLEMARLGKEYRNNYYRKYLIKKEVQYKYRGQIKTRIKHEETEESRKIREMLNVPMFTCPCCGKLVSFNRLEQWLVDTPEEIANDECPCSICYEDEMGEDL